MNELKTLTLQTELFDSFPDLTVRDRMTEAAALLTEILQNAVYTTDMSAKIESLASALAFAGASGADSDGTIADDIAVSGGVMTIVSVDSEITVSNGVMTIA